MRNVIFAFATLSFVVLGATAAQVAASDLDDCILDITYQCLDYDTSEEFWQCYKDGVELCENQSTKEIKGQPKRTLDLVKNNARKRADTMFRKHTINK